MSQSIITAAGYTPCTTCGLLLVTIKRGHCLSCKRDIDFEMSRYHGDVVQSEPSSVQQEESLDNTATTSCAVLPCVTTIEDSTSEPEPLLPSLLDSKH